MRTADHFVRRHIPRPATGPMRRWEDAPGELTVFDDGRFAQTLHGEPGRRWMKTLAALRLPWMGRLEQARQLTPSLPDLADDLARLDDPP